ncbi:MAG: DUF1761 domain-containing protein [Candidatus Thorarchaeota archaeon]|jgi:hypothetical protein
MSEREIRGQYSSREIETMDTTDRIEMGPSVWRWKPILIAWIATLGIDFLWHGGILADIYRNPNPAIIEPEQAFIRIPLGYGSLLIQVVFVYWLFSFIGVNGWRKGLRFGLMFGCLMGAASVLGQYSILTLELELLILWGLAQVFEYGAMGVVLGAGSSVASLRSVAKNVIALVIMAVLFGIVLQSTIH